MWPHLLFALSSLHMTVNRPQLCHPLHRPHQAAGKVCGTHSAWLQKGRGKVNGRDKQQYEDLSQNVFA